MIGLIAPGNIGLRGPSGGSFDPATLLPVLDMNADVGITTSSGAVDVWANQGSAGGTFTGTTTTRPTLAAAGVHGRNAIVWDGVDDELVSTMVWTSLIGALSSWTAFALMQFTSASATAGASYNDPALLADASYGDRSIGYMGGTEPQIGMFHWGGSDVHKADTTHLVAGTDQVITGFYDSSGPTLSTQIDSNAAVSGTVGAPTLIGGGTLKMGTNYSGLVRAAYKLRRLLVYSSKLTAPQIAQVQAYLASF